MNGLELKVPPLVLVTIIAASMWGLSALWPDTNIPGSLWAGLVVCMVGAGIAGLGVLAFRQAHTTVDPRTPNATSELVISGIYQRSRNPMYLGFLLLLMGWAIYLGSLHAFILLPVFILYMNRFQIEPEERFMKEKFGDTYRAYQAKVRRWL